jgi:hypothetical protein
MMLRDKQLNTGEKALVSDYMSASEKKELKRISLKSQRVIKNEALQDLIKLQVNGENAYGDMTLVIKKYEQMGFKFITRGCLKYMMTKRQQNPITLPLKAVLY